MSFLGNLFGGAGAGAEIVKGVSHAFDELIHTDQEEAEEAAQARREGYAVYMSWLESTSGSRLARRLIAVLVTGIWALEHLASVILGVASVFFDSSIGAVKNVKLVEASEMLARHASDNNALVGVVLLFYFGGPAAIDGVKGLVEKWSSK